MACFEEKLRELDRLCREHMAWLALQPNREELLAYEEPPHPTYFEIIRRLRAKAAEPASQSSPSTPPS